MLYRIGVMTLFLSLAFVGGCIWFPTLVATIGCGLMFLGRRLGHGK